MVEPQTASTGLPGLTSLEEAIQAERIATGVPGLAVAVVHDGVPILLRGFGERVDGRPVDAQTLFGIGSATKPFTAALIGALVDDGVLAWDAPVRDYLPDLRLWNEQATVEVTLRDLLAHRTGLPRHDLVWLGRDTDRHHLLRLLRQLEPSAPLRQAWQYNNLMYVLAGCAVERVLDCTWEDALRDRLLEPLGMTRTNTSAGLTQGDANHAAAHLAHRGPRRPVPYRDGTLTAPAGCLNACAADLVAWLQFNLGGGEFGGRQIVSRSTLAQLHAPSTLVLPPLVRWPEIEPIGYGLGWFVDTYRGHRVVHHGGNMDGLSAMVSLMPSAGTGVAVLTNLDRTPLRDTIAPMVYDRLLGLEPVPWGQRYREYYSAVLGGARDAAARRHETSGGAPPSHQLGEYAGDYQHPAYGTIRIADDGSELTARLGDLELELEHRHHDAFELHEHVLELSAPAGFGSSFDGNIETFTALLEPSVAPIVFTRTRAASTDERDAARFVGRYTSGPITIAIGYAKSSLTCSIGEGPAAPLVRLDADVFAIGGVSHRTIEFRADLDHTVDEIVVQPLGRFQRSGRSEGS